VIPLENRDDVRIFDIFNTNARKFTGNKGAWHIHEFGFGNDQLYQANGQHIKQGLSLWLSDNHERCSIDTLEQAYSDVYSSMRSGWIESSLEEHQDILFKEDTEKFALFVKKMTIAEEDILIRFLAGKFELEDQVKCYFEKGKIYMWIDKKEQSKIIEKFGFEIKFLLHLNSPSITDNFS
jgi:hypothetical protein